MKEVILCKYGEIILKGANKSTFESMLLREVKRRAKAIGNYSVRYMQSTVYVEPLDEEAEDLIGDMYDQIRHVFGFAGICRAAVCEKDIDVIKRTAVEYLSDTLPRGCSIRGEARRSDKKFPLSSPQVAAEVGGAILEARSDLTVDLKNPDVTIRIEIRDKAAYIHAGQDSGAGGIPAGSAGRGLLLLSGGIDSPVAGYMMMKRGLTIDCLHFESFPYTSERAKEKVLSLANKVASYAGEMNVHIISLTHLQEVLRDTIDEDYFTLVLRRFMMRLAMKVARKYWCDAVITGESIGQVASQTMQALVVTDIIADMPVFRPLIGNDKEDIIKIAREIDTFETSILPYEDCCTVFPPRHPRTRPELAKVEAQEALLDVDALVEEAFESLDTVVVTGIE